MARPTLWCRLYSEILEDPKVQMLTGDIFKFWVNCLAIATRNEGILPDDTAISWVLRIPVTDVKRFMERLTETGLVENNRKLHNWEERQYLSDNSSDRVRKHRMKRDGNVSTSVSVSVSDSGLDLKKEMMPILDDFARFMEASEAAQLPASETDLTAARFEWGRLDFQQKLDAVQGLKDRIGAGEFSDPAYRPMPQNYLAKRVWQRPVRTQERVAPRKSKLEMQREEAMADIGRRLG